MGQKLTTEQWDAAALPMHWLRSDKIKDWEKVVTELCEKWLNANAKGWYYISGKYWVFENIEDMFSFKLFVLNNKFFDDTHGTVEVQTK